MEKSKSSSENAQVSNIYQSFGTNEYGLTITYSLLSSYLGCQEEQRIDGVMGYDLSFREIENQLNFKSLSYFLLNNLGQIIHTNFIKSFNLKLNESLLYIYQYCLSNNIQYIIQIFYTTQQVLMNQIGIKLNLKLRINPTQIIAPFIFNIYVYKMINFCDYRYNSIYNQDIILHVLNLNPDFYLVIFQNVTIQQYNIMEANQRKNDIIHSFETYLICLVMASVIFLVFSWIGLYLFFRPIKELRQVFLNQLYSKFQSQNSLMKMYTQFEKKSSYFGLALKNLKIKINDINSKKCQNCHLIENFKYPKSQLTSEFYQIRNQIKFVNVNENRNLLVESQDQNEIVYVSQTPKYQELRQSLFSYISSNQTIQSEIDENIQLNNEPIITQRFL